MQFAEKLKEARKKAHLSQEALAGMAGISARTLQNYEMGKRYPANMEITVKLATALGLTAQELLSPAEETIVLVTAPDAKAQLEELVLSLSGLFSGGQIQDEDRDAAMEAIIAAYWAARKASRGSAPTEEKR
ncbi:MAG: helix-turn-helix transcriptional regulator [Clostridia bacterium]|nr:helix-turn-helix transcriptional regulator [Clostridia bacterium]